MKVWINVVIPEQFGIPMRSFPFLFLTGSGCFFVLGWFVNLQKGMLFGSSQKVMGFQDNAINFRWEATNDIDNNAITYTIEAELITNLIR